MAEIKFSRVWAMPNSATFTITAITAVQKWTEVKNNGKIF